MTLSSLPRAFRCRPQSTSKPGPSSHEGHAMSSRPAEHGVWCLLRYAVHLQEQVDQPEKSLTARVIGPLPALAFPLLSCRHKAGVPRGGCQPQQPQHKPRLWFSGRDSPCSALQPGRRLFGTRLRLPLCPSFQPHLFAFS